jgi:hypothetical protein
LVVDAAPGGPVAADAEGSVMRRERDGESSTDIVE